MEMAEARVYQLVSKRPSPALVGGTVDWPHEKKQSSRQVWLTAGGDI